MADLSLPAPAKTSSSTSSPGSGIGLGLGGGAGTRSAPAPANAVEESQLLELEEHDPVEPEVLADALVKLDNLRISAAPSRATSPVASGASSPQHPGIPSVPERIAMDRAASAPGTPHFGAQTDL